MELFNPIKMEVHTFDSQQLQEVCRLCMKTPRRKIGIFEDEGIHRQIAYKIRCCLHDLIYPGDPLPQCICPGCLVKLENNFEFLQMYLQNCRILRNVILNGSAPETEDYIKLLENGVSTQMYPREPIIDGKELGCCQDDLLGGHNMEEQEDFDWQSAEQVIEMEPQGQICQIFLPERDDLILTSGIEAYQNNFVGIRNKDNEAQQNPQAVTSIENTSANASQPTAECSGNTMHEILSKIKQEPEEAEEAEEPEEAEEQEIEVTWLMRSTDEEVDALDISKVKAEPVPLSIAVIKKEEPEPEPAVASVMGINSIDVKEEASDNPEQSGSKEINVECSKCFLVFRKEIQILRHRCIGVSPWLCKPCNKYYKTKETFSKHKKFNCSSNEFTCPSCDNVFPNKIQLARHQVTHLKVSIKPLDVTKLNTCKTCFRTFSSKASLNMHERSHLNVLERYRCLDGTDSNPPHIPVIAQSTETHSGLLRPSNRNALDQQFAKVSGRIKNLYHCTVCKAVFTNQKIFRAHNRQHGLQNQYKPMTKNKGQQERPKPTAVKLDVADKKYSNNRYSCIICRKSFDTQEILIEHKKLHDPAKTALNTRSSSGVTKGRNVTCICKICGLDCKQAVVLWSHTQEEHSNTSYKCSRCQKSFIKLSALKSHEKTHEPKLKCASCGKQYSTVKALMAHEQSKHVSPSATHLCRKCNSKFDSRSALLIHARNHQSLPKLKKNLALVRSKSESSSHTCTTCAKTFTRYDSLKRHENIHVKGKHTYYPCHFCGLKLMSVPSYKAHTERHFENMPKTQCSKCYETFYTQDFYKHICLKHQSEPSTSQSVTVKKFECELCSAVFGTQQARNSHMRIHRKNWKYSTKKMGKGTPKVKNPFHSSGNFSYTIYCPLCSKAFLSNEELQLHLKLLHSKK